MTKEELIGILNRTKGFLEPFASDLNNYTEEFITPEIINERDTLNSNINELSGWTEELQNDNVTELRKLTIQASFRNKYGYVIP